MNIKHLIISSLASFATYDTMAADASDAERAQIVRNVSLLLKDVPTEKVVPSGHASLYEIFTPQEIFCTDKAGSFVIFNGAMTDTKTQVNLTEKRIVVTFEDPNCGHCKKLMTEMNQLDNVTFYTFLIPILSPTKAKAIWCAPNPAKTWTEYMISNAALPQDAPAGCEVPFERNLVLQRKLHVNGTPALYFKDNTSVKGYVTASMLKTKLR